MTDVRRIRNLGIVAHINAGKTTLAERILYVTGIQSALGEVDDGTATMDYLVEEQRRGISINAAVASVPWRGFRLNLIDTPGHVDFTAEVERCLRVLDGVIVVLDAAKGVESQTETVWRQADLRHIPRVVFVNKMDRAAADFDASIATLRERFRCRTVAVVRPLRRAGVLVGLADIIGGRVFALAGDCADSSEQMMAWRSEVVELCADHDDAVMTAFVQDQWVEPEALYRALRLGVLAGRLVPVVAGAALRNQGVDLLLDVACQVLPSPMDVEPLRTAAAAAAPPPFLALVFKTQHEPDGVVYFVRIYAGCVALGARVGTSRGDQFTVAGLWHIHAESRDPIAAAEQGDVVALTGACALRTGDTLFAPGHPARLDPVTFPRPVLWAALEPRSSADAAVVEAAARQIAEDDPTLVVERSADAGTLLVAGIGELHLEVFQSMLRQRVGDRVRFGRPAVALLETVAGRGRADAECRDAAGQTQAIVEVEIAARPGASDWETSLPISATLRALGADLEARLRVGILAPYPTTDFVVRILRCDTPNLGDEPSPWALEALAIACRKAMAEAGSTLLEPIMEFQVDCPTDTLSGVLADLRAHRAQIESVVANGGAALVRGGVRLAQVLGYATRLRSLTRGLGSLALRPSKFAVRNEADPRGADDRKTPYKP